MADIWREELHGIKKGPALFEGQATWVRAEEHEEEVKFWQQRAAGFERDADRYAAELRRLRGQKSQPAPKPVEELRKVLGDIKVAIETDNPAIVDTFWMPEDIIRGCTVVDYIDLALDASEAAAIPPAFVINISGKLEPAEHDALLSRLKRELPKESRIAELSEGRATDSFGNDLVERELVSIILRMSRHLPTDRPAAVKINEDALDYLKRKGLMPSPLRAEETVVQSSGQDENPPRRLWLGAADDIDRERQCWFDPDEGGTEYLRADVATMESGLLREALAYVLTVLDHSTTNPVMIRTEIGGNIHSLTDARELLQRPTE